MGKFGDGMSYTRFSYSSLQASLIELDVAQMHNLLSDAKGETEVASVSIAVENVGKIHGDEVSLMFVRPPLAGVGGAPLQQLRGYQRVSLSPGQSEHLRFTITAADLSHADEHGVLQASEGEWDIFVGDVVTTLRLAAKSIVV